MGWRRKEYLVPISIFFFVAPRRVLCPEIWSDILRRSLILCCQLLKYVFILIMSVRTFLKRDSTSNTAPRRDPDPIFISTSASSQMQSRRATRSTSALTSTSIAKIILSWRVLSYSNQIATLCRQHSNSWAKTIRTHFTSRTSAEDKPHERMTWVTVWGTDFLQVPKITQLSLYDSFVKWVSRFTKYIFTSEHDNYILLGAATVILF